MKAFECETPLCDPRAVQALRSLGDLRERLQRLEISPKQGVAIPGRTGLIPLGEMSEEDLRDFLEASDEELISIYKELTGSTREWQYALPKTLVAAN